MNRFQQIPATQEGRRDREISDNSHGLRERNGANEPPTLELVRSLCQALEAQSITYCHWKSNNALDLSASGENDLDLLVSRDDAARFAEILYRLGFKRAIAPDEKQLPGVLDYFGYDEKSDTLIHAHVHYQLILGHDRTKNYRLPIERPYLESSVQDNRFRVPAPEFEFIVFVIRMILKHATWDVILARQGRLNSDERQELSWLQTRSDEQRMYGVLKEHLPYISEELFDDCVQALQPDCSIWFRARTGQQLQARLQANARRALPVDICLKLWRRAVLAIRRRIFNFRFTYRLQSGGALIAVVGGDGAGKSTAINGLYSWLSPYFEVSTEHLGRPGWSPVTVAVRGVLKIGQLAGLYPVETSFRETLNQESRLSSGYPWLLRSVCRARDRYLLYRKARRLAANGGTVILDRFPLPQLRLMDGPRAEEFVDELTDRPQAELQLSPHRGSRFARWLIELEKSYYRQIAPPDMLLVLRVDPEIAVQRKTGEDPAFVRARNTEIWELNWADVDALVIDSSKAKDDVLSEIKTLIWSEL